MSDFSSTTVDTIHVAVGVIVDVAKNSVLISKRADSSHQGGKWEFPGGKKEPGESIQQALYRELHEELGIHIGECEPLIMVAYQYPEKSVLLDVWRVKDFKGEPKGREGQPVTWCRMDDLHPENFPPANKAIINSLRLPECCLITPDASHYSDEEFLQRVGAALQHGITLFQFRSHEIRQERYVNLAQTLAELCRQHSSICMFNAPLGWVHRILDTFPENSGLHLTSERLQLVSNPVINQVGFVSASCHTVEEIARANSIQVDFITISPVLATTTHPELPGIGWQIFAKLRSLAYMPVYALGGMELTDILTAKKYGAQGIASISTLWSL